MVEFSFSRLKENLSIIYFKNILWIAAFDLWFSDGFSGHRKAATKSWK